MTAAKTVAIVQSSYIPWKGTFDLIASADELILLDDVQYTTRDWRNRNRVKGPHGSQWLTIPIRVKGRRHQRVCDAVIADPDWNERHWQTVRLFYHRARHFRAYAELVEELYLGADDDHLSAINRRFLEAVCDLLGITTTLSWSMDYAPCTGRIERLLDLCQKAGATTYLTGPVARAYLDERPFHAAGIEVRYFDFSGYREYPQLHPPFEHGVSVLDLLFNTGSRAREYLASFRPG